MNLIISLQFYENQPLFHVHMLQSQFSTLIYDKNIYVRKLLWELKKKITKNRIQPDIATKLPERNFDCNLLVILQLAFWWKIFLSALISTTKEG